MTDDFHQDPIVRRRLPASIRSAMQVAYALRRVPDSSFQHLLPPPEAPRAGDIVLACVETIGKNTALDITTGRRCALHRGDLLAVVFGNRYATLQFEGYANVDGDRCDLLSVGGLCGMVQSKHETTPDPSRLRILGALAGPNAQPLRLQDFALRPALKSGHRPRVAVVLGTSMDSGKTYTARSLILGLRRHGVRVGAIKLTGTAAGRDTYTMLDAGACVALDFTDGGLPSTFLCSLQELLDLYLRLMDHAASAGASWVVVEIADGVIQGETADLLASNRFTATVDAWVLAANDALGAHGAQRILEAVGITPLAVSGIVSRSPLCRREVEAATRLPCMAASELEQGGLNARLMAADSSARLRAVSGERSAVGA